MSNLTSTIQDEETPDSQIPYLLSFYVPVSSKTSVCSALTTLTDAGRYPGNLYAEVYWSTRGVQQFRPLPGANPTIGSVGTVAEVEEDKVEILCIGRECVMSAVKVLKEVHPYEVVPWFVVRGEIF